MSTLTDTAVDYNQLAPQTRLKAWMSLRDFVESMLKEKEAILEKFHTEDFEPPLGDSALADGTNLAKKELQQAQELHQQLQDDAFTLTYLQEGNALLDENGDVIRLLKEVPENQKLDFAMYEGSFFMKYSAESRDFQYKIIKRYDNNSYTCIADPKNTNEQKLLESERSLKLAFDRLQKHHRQHISK